MGITQHPYDLRTWGRVIIVSMDSTSDLDVYVLRNVGVVVYVCLSVCRSICQTRHCLSSRRVFCE